MAPSSMRSWQAYSSLQLCLLIEIGKIKNGNHKPSVLQWLMLSRLLFGHSFMVLRVYLSNAYRMMQPNSLPSRRLFSEWNTAETGRALFVSAYHCTPSRLLTTRYTSVFCLCETLKCLIRTLCPTGKIQEVDEGFLLQGKHVQWGDVMSRTRNVGARATISSTGTFCP